MKRYDVYLVALDPTLGSEIQKTRPCVIVSPDEMNRHIQTLIIAPMTTVLRKYPSRVSVCFQEKNGQVVLDQIRTVDKGRLIKKLGTISPKSSREISQVLTEIFR